MAPTARDAGLADDTLNLGCEMADNGPNTEQAYETRSREDAEMWCDRCKRRHGVVWSAPSDLWNLVMRAGDRGKPDEFGFCCPICFMQLADERGVGNLMWDVQMWVPEPEMTYDEASEFTFGGDGVLGKCGHGVDLDRDFCPEGCRV